MKDFAIRVTGLSKKYYLSKNKLGLPFTERLKQLFSLNKKHDKTEVFYAIKDISFEIKKGETVGIIGRNGAGKSTLLKLLSEVVEPTDGRIELNGTVASVLEVGMGFHPDLTGRENIYLSGALYGLNKKQINKSLDNIVEYSGVERFIDTPVKHYSSGMYTRLAFAIVTNIDADILLFDEVLSVGDLSFRLKCVEKIKQLAASNKTVIIVSHNTNDIIGLCTKIMCFNKGRVTDIGDESIIQTYIEKSITYDPKINPKDFVGDEENSEPGFKNLLRKEWPNIDEAPGDIGMKIRKLFIVNESRPGSDSIYTNDKFSINIEYEKFNENEFYNIGCAISYMNIGFFGCNTANSDLNMKQYINRGTYIAKVFINECFFNDVILSLTFCIFKNNERIICYDVDALHFKINKYLSEEDIGHPKITNSFTGPIQAKMKWEIIKK